MDYLSESVITSGHYRPAAQEHRSHQNSDYSISLLLHPYNQTGNFDIASPTSLRGLADCIHELGQLFIKEKIPACFSHTATIIGNPKTSSIRDYSRIVYHAL